MFIKLNFKVQGVIVKNNNNLDFKMREIGLFLEINRTQYFRNEAILLN